MNKTIWLIVAMVTGSVHFAPAADVFPPFDTHPVTIALPASTPGCFNDLGHKTGTNFIYTLNGQMFSERNEGHIQTVAEGFSGGSSKKTPWETLTEMLAFYQKGGSKEEMAALYDSTSTKFVDLVNTNAAMKERFQGMGKSIAGMRAVLGFRYSEGYLAYIRMDYKDGHHGLMPCYFVLEGGKYKISAAENKKPEPCFLNINVYLSKQLIAGAL